MCASVLYMSMRLDGVHRRSQETMDNGLGDGGERLHEWRLGTAASTTRHTVGGDPLASGRSGVPPPVLAWA
jgi:hypothetical protein